MKTQRGSQFIPMVACILLVASAASPTPADTPTVLWSQTYAGQGFAEGYGVAVDDSGVYVGGTTWPAGGKYDAFLLRYDGAGNMVWDRTWGGSNYDFGGRVTLFGSTVYMAGNTYSFAYDPVGGIEYDAITLKYSKDGVLDTSNSPDGWWTRFSGDSGYYGYDYAGSVATDELGNLYVGGDSERSTNNWWAYVERYDPAGVKQWHQHYGQWGYGTNCRPGRATLSGSNLYSVGRFNPAGDNQVLVLKYDTAGTPVWAMLWGAAGTYEQAQDVAVWGSDLFVIGFVDSDLLLLKLHDDGPSASYVASTTFAGPGNDVGYGIKVENGTVYVAGSTIVGSQTDALLLAYDTDLNFLWSYSWGETDNDSANDLVVRDGVLYVAGTLGNDAFIDAYAVIGDLNCDGVVDFRDINPFVLALSNPAAYEQTFPECDLLHGDINGDGSVNFGDINPFVALLTGGG